MSRRRSLFGLLLALFLVLAAPAARAGIPVIDATAIANLVEQIGYWKQQVAAMANQLDQLKQTYRSTTGDRGMGTLLPMSSLQRNYLPADHAELMRVADGSSATYAGLSGQVQTIMAAHAVLTSRQLGTLTPQMRQLVEDARRSAALLSSSSQAAYRNTSQRFAALQGLIDRISVAGDAKAIQDLQARVVAEQAMLTNEQTKLQTLYQLAQANHLVQQQRLREQVISNHGEFGGRFAPTPP